MRGNDYLGGGGVFLLGLGLLGVNASHMRTLEEHDGDPENDVHVNGQNVSNDRLVVDASADKRQGGADVLGVAEVLVRTILNGSIEQETKAVAVVHSLDSERVQGPEVQESSGDEADGSEDSSDGGRKQDKRASIRGDGEVDEVVADEGTQDQVDSVDVDGVLSNHLRESASVVLEASSGVVVSNMQDHGQDGDLAWSGVDLLPHKLDELGAGDPGEGDFKAECAHG